MMEADFLRSSSMTELDEKEPNLEQMSDYEKPLSKKKTRIIILAFALALAVYFAYAILMGGL